MRACDGAYVDNGPACLCHCGRRDPFVSVALATARTQLAAIRASELELDTVLHGLRDQISNYCLLAPSRRRQRLPVQLWGQLQRPCCVLGAATDSWSLQRRCSATITRVVVSLGRRSHRDRLDSS